ncbi:unnamed protein product [Albugo candida]|uniref:WW domain-containing protein n=1 Tax=Albugo candida TaxID=65357 RepID=A0A024GPS6_9STRA|nr:unnamed protein product [Albugo candida]|eukprot:CCI48799.1 unnamed protein product [Albugo candida]
MISRLRFNGSNAASNDNGMSNGSTAKSIFSNIGLSTIGSNSTTSATATPEAKQSPDPYSDTKSYGDSIINDTNDEIELPLGWRLVSSRHSGREYYLHIATGHTQWDRPTSSEAPKVASQVQQQKQTNVFGTGSVFTSGVSRMGAGLTSMFSQANTKLQTTLQNNVGTSTRVPSSKNSHPSDKDTQLVAEIFEYERLDGKMSKISDPKRYSDRLAIGDSGSETFPEGDLPEGYEWTSEWEIDKNYTLVDRDGWTYAAEFKELIKLLDDDASHASRHPTDAVRRRRWMRFRQPCQDLMSSTGAPIESPQADGTPSSTTSWLNESSSIDSNLQSIQFLNADDDDPFSRTAQKQQTGFRMNIKFTHRGGKDTTKDYQSISLSDINWLVNERDNTKAPTDEILREKTANLEERIKEATNVSMRLERVLRERYDKKSKEIEIQQQKLNELIAQYQKCRSENETLESVVSAHRIKVEALRKEATEKDILQNEEQRAINAELEATNQALEEKAKALATARLRYKRDNKALQAAVEDAKQRLEQQQRAKIDNESQNPVAQEVRREIEKLRQLHTKLEAMREHRLALEEESKALFNVVVEKKADLKFKSKKKMEAALKDVEEQIRNLKSEQAALAKRLSQKAGNDDMRQLNTKRNAIRSELGALKERRTLLLAEKRKLENTE